jgi:hypothetical protein
LVYHFKVVGTADIQNLIENLALNGIVEPEAPREGDEEVDISRLNEAYIQNQEAYERKVAQAIYKLPTVWPPVTEYWIDLNHSTSVLMSPKFWVSLYLFCSHYD